MRLRSRAISVCMIAVAVLLTASAARADWYAAVAAYESKDHARAFELFRELAELGHPPSQENLAVMYALGEGVKRDNIAAYAWAQMSRESEPRENAQAIIDQIEKSLTPEARVRVAELQGRFGKQALQKELLPIRRDASAAAGANPPEQDQPICRMTRPVNPGTYYPPAAAKDRVSGAVLLEATVHPDGRSRNPRVLLALPQDTFDTAGRQVILDSVYEAPVINGVAVPCTLTYWARFKVSTRETERLLAIELEKLKQGVAKRDPQAQLQYAFLSSGWKDMNPERKNVTPLIIAAAQAGLPTAQFAVGIVTIKGWGVIKDEAKGMRWLELSANAGQPEAQVMLATELLRAKPDAEDLARARELLEKAAAAGSASAKFLLADLLLGDTGSIPADPRRSLALLGDVMSSRDDDPSAFEIRAAAMSQLGDYAGAVAAQKRALGRAGKLRWDPAQQEQRLALYEKNQAWTQRLLDY